MTPFHRATMLGLASLGLLALAACTTTSPNYGYGNQGLSRDPCGIDLIMPLPAPAKGCVASA